MDRKEILIIGGTGTLGVALLSKLTTHRLTVLSREELKQKKTQALFPNVKFVLGDIRDPDSLRHCEGKDVVFHLAAMKHVEMAEVNAEESIKINLIGTMNVAKACLKYGVPYCVFSSTDKAVLPINNYGMCKALSEKYLFDLNRTGSNTRFSVFRWGNVLGSRGSVIHSFLTSLESKKSVDITDVRMTRFWIDINDAANFMLEHYEDAPKDRASIPKMKSSRLIKIAELCAKHLGLSDYKTNLVGIRSGEKIHECIYSDHDYCIRSDTAAEYSDDEILEMIARVKV